MIDLGDRRIVAQNIVMAHTAGARLRLAARPQALTSAPCSVGWPMRAHSRRWQAERSATHARHAFSAAERAQLLAVANEPRFAAVPPAHIVPMLADARRASAAAGMPHGVQPSKLLWPSHSRSGTMPRVCT